MDKKLLVGRIEQLMEERSMTKDLLADRSGIALDELDRIWRRELEPGTEDYDRIVGAVSFALCGKVFEW
jgi:hypothetical protein